VTYGNIGSPDRLDFTVVGSAVNVASHVQELTEILGIPVLATQDLVNYSAEVFTPQGNQHIRELNKNLEMFSPNYT